MTSIVLQNAAMSVRIDPEHGAEITHLEDAIGRNMLFLADWCSPLPLSHGSYGDGVLDWLASYRGGWQELFPNAGAACAVLGTPLPFHGEASRAMWQVEACEPESCTVSTGTRLPLVLRRRMRIDPARPVLHISEEVANESNLTVPFVWGHHPAFGPPLAAPGARIDIPDAKVFVDQTLTGPYVDLEPGSVHRWGSVTGRDGARLDLDVVPAGPAQRLCYLTELSEGWFAIRNEAAGIGLAVRWDLQTFPHLWFWQEIAAGQGMPWYGRGQITAIEPASQFPAHGLEAAIKAGTARHLGPGEIARTGLSVTLFKTENRPVSGVAADGTVQFSGGT